MAIILADSKKYVDGKVFLQNHRFLLPPPRFKFCNFPGYFICMNPPLFAEFSLIVSSVLISLSFGFIIRGVSLSLYFVSRSFLLEIGTVQTAVAGIVGGSLLIPVENLMQQFP